MQTFSSSSIFRALTDFCIFVLVLFNERLNVSSNREKLPAVETGQFRHLPVIRKTVVEFWFRSADGRGVGCWVGSGCGQGVGGVVALVALVTLVGLVRLKFQVLLVVLASIVLKECD